METTWIGGRCASPLFVGDENEDGFQADIILWFDVTSGLVVGFEVAAPTDPALAVAQSLRRTLDKPMAGPRRRPARLRVATAELAALLGPVAAGIAVEVAPTPELDRIVDHMGQQMPGANPVLAGFRRTLHEERAAVAQLIPAAARVFLAQPWSTLWDADVLRLDVPELDVSGWCVSVIGRLRQSFGLILFRSREDYLQQLAFADALAAQEDGPPSVAMPEAVSLSFAARGELPGFLRKEIVERGWTLDHLGVYPIWFCSTADGAARVPTAAELSILAAASAGMAEHLARFQRELAAPEVEPHTGEYPVVLGARTVTARITSPHPEIPWVRASKTLRRRAAPKKKSPPPRGGRGKSRP